MLQQQAASTSVWAATAEELNGVSGQYLNNCWLCAPTEKVNNLELGKALWSICISMIERVVGRIPDNSQSTNK
jgi:WW domain-containing oxidoreductase